MGKRVAVNVAVNKLVTDTPDNLKEMLLGAFLTDEDIPSSIIQGATSGFNLNCQRYYEYGQNHYVEGLPGTATFTAGAPVKDKRDAVITILEGLAAEPIRILELQVRAVNLQTIAKEWLQDTVAQDWDPIRQVLNSGGLRYEVYSVDFVSGFLNIRLKRENTDVNSYTPDHFLLTVVTDIPTIATNEVYYQVVYHLVSDPYYSRTYWNYKHSLGTYPTLDLGTDVISGSTFMPIAPIRRNGVNVVDDNTFNKQQKSSVRELLQTVSIDLQEMTDSLIDPDNPNDLDDIDEVFVAFVMNLDSNVPIALAYLFESFRTFHYAEAVTQATWVSWFNGGQVGARPKNAIYLNDSSISSQIEWNFTTLQVKNGLVGDGDAAPDPFSIVTNPTEVPYSPTGNDDIVKVTVVDAVNTELEFNVERNQNETKLPDDDADDLFVTHSYILRRQLTTVADGDPSDTYEELLIHGLLATYDVYRGAARGRGEFVRDITTMSDGGFVIPVSFDVIESFNGFDESLIYYESLQLIVFAVQIVKLAWYQSSIFAILITIIVLAVAIWFAQPQLAAAWATGYAGFAIFILKAYFVSYVIDKTFTFLGKELGAEVALALAIMIAAYGLTKGDAKTFGKLISAENFLMVSNGLLSGATAAIQLDIQEESRRHGEAMREIEAEQEKLDEVNKMLNNSIGLDLYALTRLEVPLDPFLVPQSFVAEKIGTGNPGVGVLDIARNFVEVSTQLPDALQLDINDGTTLKGI